MKLLKLVKERRDEFPQDDVDFGSAILRLIGEEIEVCHFLADFDVQARSHLGVRCKLAAVQLYIHPTNMPVHLVTGQIAIHFKVIICMTTLRET